MKERGDSQVESAKDLRLTKSELEAARLLASYLDCLEFREEMGVEEFRSAHPDLAKAPLEELTIFDNLGKLIDAAETLPSYGEFDLVRELGHGGMGVVYEARQRSLDRKVALKVLKGGALADRKSIARFEREAKLTAGLHHPNIVCVYSLGTDKGLPYYAMELAPGKSLRQVLERVPPALKSGKGHENGDQDTTRRLLLNLSRLFTPHGDERPAAVEPATIGARPAKGADRRSRRPRLRLRAPLRALTREYCMQVARAFAGAAEGLQHAHARNVVHRDLKPSNLMLDPNGDLRILDFGLAWAKDLPHLSHSRELVGTPFYMSPEQAQGLTEEIGPATDIYSLGVTLYETLAWQRPFPGNNTHEIQKRIIRADPPLLRRLNPDLPLDLETIVDKCLRKEPRRRFGTAEALAQELRRFAEGKPIETQPTSKTVRWGRRVWGARHRIAKAAALGIFLILGAVVWDDRQDDKDKQRRDKVLGILNSAVLDLRSPQLYALPPGLRLLKEQPLRIVDRGDQAVFQDLPRGGQSAHSPAREIVYEAGPALLEVGPNLIRDAVHSLEAGIEEFPEQGSIYYRLAQGRILLDRSVDVGPLLAEALRQEPDLLAARGFLISLLERNGDPAAVAETEKVPATGKVYVKQWIAAQKAELDQDWEAAADAYDQIMDQAPPGGEGEDVAFEVYLSRGIARFKAGRLQRASEDFARCRERKAERLDPLLCWGKAQLLLGNRKDANRAFQDAWERAAPQAREQDRDRVAIWAALGLKEIGDPENALVWAGQVAQPYRRLVLEAEIRSASGEHEEAIAAAREALSRAAPAETLASRLLLGNLLAASGDLASARAEYELAAQLQPDDPGPRAALGSALMAEDRLAEAKASFEEALVRDGRLAAAHYGLATVLFHQGSDAKDAALLRQARDAYKTCLRYDPGHAAARTNVGLLLDREGRHEEALQQHRRATILAPALAVAHYNHGFSLLRLQRYREAVPAFEEAIQRGLGEGPTYYNLAIAYHYLGMSDLAIRSFDAALARNPDDFEAYHGRGVTKLHVRRFDEAIKDLARSVEGNPNWFKSRNALGEALDWKERWDEAIAHCYQAIQIDPGEPNPYRVLAGARMKSRLLPEGQELAQELKLLEQAEGLAPAWWETHHALEVYRRALLPRSISFASIDWRLATPLPLVPEGATWRFFRGLTEPLPGWMEPDFDDVSWEEGPAGFGSGDVDDVKTPLADMAGGQYLSVYLRHRFRVTHSERFQGLELRVRADDGYIAYLNGREIGRMRSGAPGEPRAFEQPADDWTIWGYVVWRIAIPATEVRAGENLLAVHGTSRMTETEEARKHDFALHPTLHAVTAVDDEALRRAREMFEEFLATSPGEAQAAYFEGRILQLDGEPEAAEARFRRARDLERESPEPYLRLAECMRSRGQGEEAGRLLAEAIGSGLHRHAMLWDAWFAGQLEKTPQETIEEFPRRRPGTRQPDRGDDLLWILRCFADGEPARIDCGAGIDSVVDGVRWSRDRFYRGGNSLYIGGEDVRKPQGIAPDVPCATNRHFFDPPERFPAYRIPLLRGGHLVTLHFMEGMSAPESRAGLFDVLLEGKPRIENYDAGAKGFKVPDPQPVEVEVLDGFLDVGFRRRSRDSRNWPSLVGIEIEGRR